MAPWTAQIIWEGVLERSVRAQPHSPPYTSELIKSETCTVALVSSSVDFYLSLCGILCWVRANNSSAGGFHGEEEEGIR